MSSSALLLALGLGAGPLLAEVRVLALGDSHTEGAGVAPTEAYPSQLERALNSARGPRVRVVNAGISGSCILEKRAAYRRAGGRYDWVLLQLGIDIERIALHLRADRGRTSWEWRAARGLYERFPGSDWARAVWQRVLRRESGRVSRWLASPDGASLHREAEDVLVAQLNALYRETSAEGARIVVLRYGSAGPTEEAVGRALDRSRLRACPRVYLEDLPRRARERLGDEKIYLPDSHLNPRGYRLWVERMLESLPPSALRTTAR